jgi:hypothetical protein
MCQSRGPDLDYCILRLKQDSGRDPLPLTRTPTQITAASYLPLNIIQHPQGNAKRFAVRNNLAVDADDTFLKYYTIPTTGRPDLPCWTMSGKFAPCIAASCTRRRSFKDATRHTSMSGPRSAGFSNT